MDSWEETMDPMDGELLDSLAEKAKRNSRKGRKAKRRLEHLLKRRVQMAEDAVRFGPQRTKAKEFTDKWFAGFDKGAGKDIQFLSTYAVSDARATPGSVRQRSTARGHKKYGGRTIMLTIEFHGGVPYLSTEKGPVGFVKKMTLSFVFEPVSAAGFIVTKFVIDRSGVKDNLNVREKELVEFEP
jgi:hypothetical protein